MALLNSASATVLEVEDGDNLELDVVAHAVSPALGSAIQVTTAPAVCRPVSVCVTVLRKEVQLDMTEKLSVAKLIQRLGLLPSAKVSKTICQSRFRSDTVPDVPAYQVVSHCDNVFLRHAGVAHGCWRLSC